MVVRVDPRVKIHLQLLDRRVDFLAERDLVELIQDGLVEPLADPVGLWRLGPGARVVDVVDCHMIVAYVTAQVSVPPPAT